MKRNLLFPFLALAILVTLACGILTPTETPASEPEGPANSITIEATSPIALLEQAGLFAKFTEQTGIAVHLQYYGDVDLLLKVNAYSSNRPGNVDAIWVGSPLWAPGGLLQEEQSVMRTWVVAGIDPATADALGWPAGQTITMAQFLDAARSGMLSLAVPNASQDDAGANFYFATISGLNPGHAYIRKGDVDDKNTQEQLIEIYGAVKGSDSDAGRLADRFVNDRLSGNPQYNGFILPEAFAIASNLRLQGAGSVPMRVIYIEDALAVQSYQIGWVDDIPKPNQKAVQALVRFLLDQEEFADDGYDAQGVIQSQAYFRTGTVGMTIANPDTSKFNPSWGIITDRDFVPANMPKDKVVTYALNKYQTLFKKPSATAYCLDFSGSMDGSGETQRDRAMTLLLDQGSAVTYLLPAGSGDHNYVLKFHHIVDGVQYVQGNNVGDLNNLLDWTTRHDVVGNTNIYGCVYEALELLKNTPGVNEGQVLPAVIMLTDGENTENTYIYNDTGYNGLRNYYQANGLNIPVYSIMLGKARESDLNPLVTLTNSALCDGRGSEDALMSCFREFKGSN